MCSYNRSLRYWKNNVCNLAKSIKYHMFPAQAKTPKVRPSANDWVRPSAKQESVLWTFVRTLGFASGDDAEASQVSPSKVSEITEAPATTSPKNAAPSQNVAPSVKPASDSSVKGPHTCSYGINCLFPNLVPINCQRHLLLLDKEVNVCMYHVYTVYMLYIF